MTRPRMVLARNGVVVRSLRRMDEDAWLALRHKNRQWLRPWEAQSPPGTPQPTATFASFLRAERADVRDRRSYPAIIVWDDAVVGRVSVSGVRWGAECSGSLGYWVDQEYVGRGIAPTAAALLTEHVFRQGLHRVEIAVQPDNTASVHVAEKLGFRDEGVRRKHLYIDGAWRDHRIFALTADEPREGPFWAGGS